MSRISHPDFTCEQLIEALEKNRGFIHAAQKYLSNTYGIKTSSSTIKTKIRDWDMQEWLDDIRASLVEDCVNKVFHKGIKEGDNHCIFWVLNHYDHHVDFLDGKNSDPESKKGWRELLFHVKGNIESDTEKKFD